MSFDFRTTAVFAVALALSVPLQAEEGILVVHVEDVKGNPVSGVELAPKGDGAPGAPTDRLGKTRLRVAPATRPGQWVTLQILPRKSGPDWVFVSPWNQRTLVPSFANESENYVPAVVGERGNRDLLASDQAIKALAARTLEQIGPRLDKSEITNEERKRVLTEQAAAFGLKPDEVDKAIRAWGAKTQDPYDAGLAALYARNYPEAEEHLEESLKVWRRKQAEAQAKIAERAFFLGQSRYEQGKYREAAAAYQESIEAGGENDLKLTNLGSALLEAGDLQGAGPHFKRALELSEKSLGAEHPDVATDLNNLAGLYDAQGRYGEAEPLYQRALRIWEKTLGTEHPDVAMVLDNLAGLYDAQSRYREAEPLHQRSLRIREKVLGAEHPDTATSLSNLAGLYESQGRYSEAEPLYQRSLKIREKVFGAEHPDVANSLHNLAALYESQGRYSAAEPLYQRALRIWEKTLGAEHPDVAASLNNLASLSYRQEKIEIAEEFSRRALAIAEKSLGSCHPNTVMILENRAEILIALGRTDEAQALLDRMKLIQTGGCKP